MKDRWRIAFEKGCAQELEDLFAQDVNGSLLESVPAPFAQAMQSPHGLALLRVLSRQPQAAEWVDVADIEGKTALWIAIGREKPLELALLLRTGADPHQRNPQGLLPAWFAAWQGQPVLLQILFHFGANAEDSLSQPRPILELAIESRSQETFALLLERPDVDLSPACQNGKGLSEAMGSLQSSWIGLLEHARKRLQAQKHQEAWQLSFPAAGWPDTTPARL